MHLYVNECFCLQMNWITGTPLGVNSLKNETHCVTDYQNMP